MHLRNYGNTVLLNDNTDVLEYFSCPTLFVILYYSWYTLTTGF